jgi:aminoglycoside 3-N-acetyltransferase I
MNLIISRFRQEDSALAAKVMFAFTQNHAALDRLASFLAADSNFFLVATMGEHLVGFAYAYELARPDGDAMLFLYSIDVLPEHRRQGVATALLSYLRQVAAQRRLKKLFVIADRSNVAAVAFYQATGGIVEDGDSLCFVYPSPKP